MNTQNIRTEQVQDPGKGSTAKGGDKAPKRLTKAERRQIARRELTALRIEWEKRNQLI